MDGQEFKRKTMPNREFKINEFMSRGIIESNIEFSKTHNSPLSVMKFGYEVDLDDGFFFKDLIAFIHSFSDFNSILQQPHDTFIIFLRDCKIHQAKTIVSQMIQKIKYKFKIDIKHLGITLLDAEDTYKSLLDRLDKYYVMSKLSTKSKIFYGTLDFDFYETQSDKKVLENIFKKLNTVKLYNFYQGLPVTEDVKILHFDKGLIQIKLDPIKVPFYENEEFTFIQHDLIPTVIKATIVKLEAARSLMVLGNLEFLDSSPVERSSMRVEPDRLIYASLAIGKKTILDGNIISIAENSVVLQVHENKIADFAQQPLWDTELNINFQIATKKSFLTPINTKAMIYSIINDKVVLTITPSTPIKTKLRTYISLRQNDVLDGLKQDLKKFKK